VRVVDAGAADDYDVIGLAALLDFHRPGGAAPRVARREIGGQYVAAEADLIPVVEHAADLDRGAAAAAGFHHRHVAIHHHQLGAGELLHPRGAGGMIAVRVADEENLDILKFEAELLDALLNQRDRIVEIGIDQNMTLV